ncbi:L,D-transpeptidase [Acidobacteria bacterium AB60]|nr:L,D-transpeptidase [Acidobacteria bacterium AB60]
MHATAQESPTNRVLVVSIQDRKLALVEDGQVRKIYNVAVGKPATPSPVGTFKIVRRVANPVYQHEGKTVQPGPANPVGTRWMGLSIPGYGIHGTNVPNSIGKATSHGCIRLGRADLEELYALVSVGDTVELIAQPNEETAAIFHPLPATLPQQPAVLAQTAPAVAPAGNSAGPDISASLTAVAAGSR